MQLQETIKFTEKIKQKQLQIKHTTTLIDWNGYISDSNNVLDIFSVNRKHHMQSSSKIFLAAGGNTTLEHKITQNTVGREILDSLIFRILNLCLDLIFV